MANRLEKIESVLTQKSSPLLKITYKTLKPEHEEATLDILSEAFAQDQPLTIAYGKKYPQYKYTRADWKQWLSYWSKDATSNELSTGAFLGDQLIGALLCNGYGYENPDYDKSQKFHKPTDALYQILTMGEILEKQYPKDFREKLEKQKTVDCWIVGIKKQFQSQRDILIKLFKLCSVNIYKSTSSSAIGLVSNKRTARGCEKMGGTKIASMPIRDFQIGGIKPYSDIEENHNQISVYYIKIK